MENQVFIEILAARIERIRQAMSRGPLGRQKGFIGTEDKVSPEVPVEEVSAVPVRPFARVRQALEIIGEITSRPLLSVTPPGQEGLSVDKSEGEEPSSVDLADAQHPQSNLDILRRAQRANVARSMRSAPVSDVVAPVSDVVAPVSDVVAPASDVVAPASDVVAPVSDVVAPASDVVAPASDVAPISPSASQGPSLPDLLKRMGRWEFCRVVQDTLLFDRARYGLGTGYDFQAAEARTGGPLEAAPLSSPADQAVLRAFIREGIAVRGIEKTEDALRMTLYLEDVRARQVSEKTIKSQGKGVSKFDGPAPMTAKEVETLAAKYLQATMAPDWTPKQESPENVACVERGFARVEEDWSTRRKIYDIAAMEQKIAGMEVRNSTLILGSGLQPREEWAPRAYELLAIHERNMGRPVNEEALDSLRKESGIYRLWRAFVRVTAGKKEEPVESVSVSRELEPASTPSVPSGKIREVRGGVYELQQG